MNILISKALVAVIGKNLGYYLTPNGIILAGRLNKENELREKNEPVLLYLNFIGIYASICSK